MVVDEAHGRDVLDPEMLLQRREPKIFSELPRSALWFSYFLTATKLGGGDSEIHSSRGAVRGSRVTGVPFHFAFVFEVNAANAQEHAACLLWTRS